MTNENEVEWMEFDPDDPRVEEIKSQEPHNDWNDDWGCGWIVACGFVIFISLVILTN